MSCKRVVERMAHMQRAGDIRRRDDDAERLGPVAGAATGGKGAAIFPGAGDALFDAGGIVGLFHHGIWPQQRI
jgi:hypothetical protein